MSSDDSYSSSICSDWETIEYEFQIQKYLQEEREPIPIRPIPNILKLPHYDESLTRNQRIVRNFVVNIKNMYVAYCLLNRKGLEYMVAIHQCKENAIIKAGGYPYCDGDYIASQHFDNPEVLYPPEMRVINQKLITILTEIKYLVRLLRSMWIKLSLLDEMNPGNVAFNRWTWEAIELAFEILYRAFLKESRILDSLASALVHSSNFTKMQRCIQTWCEQRAIKDEDLNLLKTLLQEVGIKETKL